MIISRYRKERSLNKTNQARKGKGWWWLKGHTTLTKKWDTIIKKLQDVLRRKANFSKMKCSLVLDESKSSFRKSGDPYIKKSALIDQWSRLKKMGRQKTTTISYLYKIMALKCTQVSYWEAPHLSLQVKGHSKF